MEFEKDKCQWCGNDAPAYNSIYVPGEDKNLQICLHCYNKEISKAAGIEYEDIQLHPVVLKDLDGMDHEFRFSLRLMGGQQVLCAHEVKADLSSGYEFKMIGETKEGIFPLFSRLYEQMLKSLSRKHISRNTEIDQWQITGDDTVRGQISSVGYDDAQGPNPLLIIDGKKITWDEFAQMVLTYEGFNFKLQIFDQNDEKD